MVEMYAYDVECFRNYFLAVFIDVREYIEIRKNINPNDMTTDEFESHVFKAKRKIFRIGLGHNDISALVSFVNRDIILASFNGLDYDNILINACIGNINYWHSTKKINENLYSLSKRVISNQNANIFNDNRINVLKYMRTFYRSIDVQKVFGLNKIRKSLKQTLINIKWYNIEDYVMPEPMEQEITLYKGYEANMLLAGGLPEWDRYVMDEHEKGLFWYCNNDTLGVCEIIFIKSKDIKLRFDVTKKYGVDVLSSSESNMADKLFAKFYCEASDMSYGEYYKGRTERQYIPIEHCIPSTIKFQSDELKKLVTDLKCKVIYNTKGELNFKVDYHGNTYKLKTGGLHSNDKPAKFVEDNENYIIDADVTSYYPFIVRNFHVSPAHMDADIFIGTTANIVDDRVEAKATGDSITNKTFKIVVNSGIFGKMGFPDSPAYDPKAMVTVTISGQLLLLMLVESIEAVGCKVISANTDGIVAIVPKNKLDDYYTVCNKWCTDTNFDLEYSNYSMYVRRDVNSYMAVYKDSGDIKFKGAMNPDLYKEDLRKGYKNPIVAKAVANYYLKDIPIMDTITECTDIMDFCATQKPGSQFKLELNYVKDGKSTVEVLSKNIRFYVSKGQHKLKSGLVLKNNTTKKRGEPNKYTNIVSNKNVTIFNRKYKFDNFDDYKIDYGYYYSEARKIIQAIESRSTNKKQIKRNYGQHKIEF